MYITTLLLEAGVVAAITALALALAVYVTGPISTVQQALMVGTVLGAMIHLTFELAGANAYYCTGGAACRG